MVVDRDTTASAGDIPDDQRQIIECFRRRRYVVSPGLSAFLRHHHAHHVARRAARRQAETMDKHRSYRSTWCLCSLLC
jgi:hypothetical protein